MISRSKYLSLPSTPEADDAAFRELILEFGVMSRPLYPIELGRLEVSPDSLHARRLATESLGEKSYGSTLVYRNITPAGGVVEIHRFDDNQYNTSHVHDLSLRTIKVILSGSHQQTLREAVSSATNAMKGRAATPNSLWSLVLA